MVFCMMVPQRKAEYDANGTDLPDGIIRRTRDNQHMKSINF